MIIERMVDPITKGGHENYKKKEVSNRDGIY